MDYSKVEYSWSSKDPSDPSLIPPLVQFLRSTLGGLGGWLKPRGGWAWVDGAHKRLGEVEKGKTRGQFREAFSDVDNMTIFLSGNSPRLLKILK